MFTFCSMSSNQLFPPFLQIQEFRTGATRQNMETVHAKEESKRLRQQLTDLRAKLADLEAKVMRKCEIVLEIQLALVCNERSRRWMCIVSLSSRWHC